MSREHKYRVYSFLDKCFHYFDIYAYPSGIAGGVSEPQQYTGCHDSANKEIYEGDIVKYNNGDVIRIGYIEFMAGIFFLNFPDQTDEELGYLLVSNLKVIGNKFEPQN
jgi:hypothetical protein